MTFEETLSRLEAIVRALDADDMELDRALQLFEEGISLLRTAATELSRADARLKVLTERAGGVFELRDPRA
jgi:exodeoxyribonuclease VII small subunit